MLSSIMQNARLRLLDVPVFAACIPGTETLDVSENTLKKYEEVCRLMVSFFAARDGPKKGNRRVVRVSRQDYSQFHDWLATRGTRAITTNGYRRRIRAVWNRLAERGVPVCDISGITKEELEPYQKGRAIDDDQLDRILQVACVRDAAIILYTLGSGIRRQTVPRLTTENTLIWQSDDGSFRIASKIPKEKTSPPRLVMAGNEAAKAVDLWLTIRKHKDSPWIFNAMNDGGQLQNMSINTMFRNLRIKANIPHGAEVYPHALRHRFAQDQLSDNDAKIVSQWMGITVETLLTVYAHRSQERLVIERFGDSDFPRELLDSSY